MALDTGDRAPDFTLLADDGDEVSLADFSGKGLVMYFYPKAFTPGCTAESCDFRDRSDALHEAGYEIIGISPDPPRKLAEFREKYHLPFRLLSDPGHEVADAYGAWGTKKNYGLEYEGIIRSTFVVGPDGAIEEAMTNVRAKGHAERVLTRLQGD